MGQKVTLTWYRRSHSIPAVTRRILIFCPNYPEDSDMRYRIIDSQFWNHMSEATHWAELPEEPKE